MRHFIHMLGFFTLILCAQPTLAQVATTSTGKQSTAELAKLASQMPIAEELQTAKQQIKILESQLQMTRDYQGSLLDTVYWALGAVFLLVGLLLGFGWFANFRVYERDKEILKAELEGAVRSKADDLEKSISLQTDNISRVVIGKIDEKIKIAETSLNYSLQKIDGRLFDLEFVRLHDKMNANGSDNMALTDALQLLDICIKRDFYKVPDVIHFMLKTIDKGGKFTAGEITRLNVLLDSLPSQYRALLEKLGAKLVAADIF
ncbi:hypothetical protein [Pseudomonas fluorescens]|uniref:Uncharacterized protein n=1 Tax=Pseudomonas fluorescens TaxID=294 RepID=A0A5E7UUZ6_PSEFL|nr:hypothetical protein [Pseudomonas fluorescens]VVN92396.1 hypothetical protein PS833_01976 [Pseudomonas fluorescens]VVQ14339.1 hypothetical protein PS914_05589 [Pseudomonas fluorescens]